MWRARLRKAPKDRDEVWMYDYLDVSDPDRPVYQVLRRDGTDMQDVSRDYGVNGWPDEWRDASGAPVLPYVWYHAERTGGLWDAFENLGLVRGTLLIALYRTYLKHVMRTSSFRQRYAINAEVVGAQVEADGAERQHTIIPDPATILNFRTAEGDGLQAQVGAFPEPIRPSDLMEAIEKYERSVLSDAGLGAIDQQRTSGDPRSGYAIHVSMAALEAAQRDAWRQFARGDAELLRVAACIHNRTQGDTVPETGYEVVYRMAGQVQPVAQQEQTNRTQEADNGGEM